ncbi:MAG: hypothetical protein JXA96_02815 [Sedimentisphaerales bacterium]|nr:hypothetical protein [Sedimentisphaerales bacterium]
MTPVNKQWENLKNDYVHQVEKALSSVKHPRSKEVLEDIREHLDRRFWELPPDQQTLENFQTIISEMGPACDYAELLEPQMSKSRTKSQKKYLVALGFAAVIIFTLTIFLPQLNSAQEKNTIPGVGRIEDKIDYPFVNDSNVIGAWKSVDFVKTKTDFKPGEKSWKGELFLNHLIFVPNGSFDGGLFNWTKGFVINVREKTASAYDIKNIDDNVYMFVEWKGGDYTILHQKPSYYVLKKVSLDDVKSEAMFGQTADIPITSTIDESGRIADKIDYPFKNDPEVVGSWESVDSVTEVEEFKPKVKSFKGDLYLKELFVLEGGKTNLAVNWTKGLFLNPVDKTASKYMIKKIEGTTYMFFEWKTGDYVVAHRKPSFYVLKKVDRPYVESRTQDNIDYPFVEDTQVIGTWKSIDFVDYPDQFNPKVKNWIFGELYLKELIFLPNGKTPNSWQTWTKGLVLDSGNKTASKYIIKEIDNSIYMFFEWKSGDYTIRGMKPKFYVLKKE